MSTDDHHLSSFELARRERRAGPRRTPRTFLDFIVDGESLYDLHTEDLITCLGWVVATADEHAAARLLLKAPPDLGDRVALYVCPECGDLACGAITARVTRDDQSIVWASFAMSWRDVDDDDWTHDTQRFAGWPTFRFAAQEYSAAIRGRTRPT